MSDEDVTAIFDKDLNLKFEDTEVIVMKVDVERRGRLMQHPLENGSSVSDHFVIDPIEMEVVVIFRGENIKDQYQIAVQSFLSGELLTVQTRSGSYANMVIEAMPHDETADMVDVLPVSLRLLEARFVEVVYAPAPAKASNKPTVKRGEQAPQQSSLAYRIFH